MWHFGYFLIVKKFISMNINALEKNSFFYTNIEIFLCIFAKN